MIRFLLCCSLISIFAFAEGHAMNPESSAESPSIKSAPSTPKRKREGKESQETPSPKRFKVERSPECQCFSPLRRKLIHLEYKNGIGKKCKVDSPTVRNAYKTNDWKNHWTGKIHLNGNVIYTADLFDFDAKILNKDGTWETNLERMEKGECPIGRKGIVTAEQRKLLKSSEIYSQQKKYRVEIHHATQKDPSPDEDPEENPLYMMTNAAHMGKNARAILDSDTENGGVIIVHLSLVKEEAEALCKKDQRIATNLLHFRKGKTLVKRERFSELRVALWKLVAKKYADEKKALIQEEITMTTTDFFAGPAPAIEINEDAVMDKENFSPLEDLFTTFAPSSGFLSNFSPPSSPVKLQKSVTKSSLK